jgi:hypothetical protein
MTSPIPPSGPEPPQVRAIDVTEVGKLIREELDRNNKYLEFAQGQIEKDRGFYRYLYGFAAGFIGLMVLVAGFFQYTSVNQMRTDMKASVDAELERNKAEIAALSARAAQASAEAQYTVSRELANVRTEVQKRIDTEFQSDNIKAQIATAAKERTEKEFNGIIRSVTSEFVAKGIQEEHPFIQKTVEDETRESVKQLQPTISSLVIAATEEQVKKSVQPIQAQMATYGDYIRIGTLSMLANSDDRNAFDTLVQIDSGKSKDSGNPELLYLARSTLTGILGAKQSGFRTTRQFNQKQTSDSLKQFMRSPNTFDREAALDAYPSDDRSILPILVEMIRADRSIDVLIRAVEHFNALTKQSFQFFQTKDILDWWASNQRSFQ